MVSYSFLGYLHVKHMIYDHFIGTIRKNQTSHVKAISFQGSCAIERVPNALSALIPDITKALENNFHKLCKKNQVIALFGIQPGPPLLESEQPLQLNRVLSKSTPKQHLCLSLQYVVAASDKLEQLKNWEGASTLIIDFTTGLIMDSQYYFAKYFNCDLKGTVYAQIKSSSLDKVWNDLLNVETNISCFIA